MADQDIDELIPLVDSWFYVLWALAERPLHGYGIIRRFDNPHKTRVKMSAAIVYRNLPQLIELGLIARREPPEGADRRRIYYRITADGVRTFMAQVRLMEDELEWAREAVTKLLEDGCNT